MKPIRRLITAIALVASALGIAACAPPVTSGRVVGKTYTPAHYASVYVPNYRTVCNYSGTHCHQIDDSYYRQEWQVATYQLVLANGSGKNERTGSVQVDQQTWDRAHVGERYP